MTIRERVTPAMVRRAQVVALAAVTIDALYTTRYWLMLGRPHPARRYFLILGQLSVEAAAIAYLLEQLKRSS